MAETFIVPAREYGLPCVAGTVVGTSVIPDGARIHVNGSTGMVWNGLTWAWVPATDFTT